jgi:hypothetical protein
LSVLSSTSEPTGINDNRASLAIKPSRRSSPLISGVSIPDSLIDLSLNVIPNPRSISTVIVSPS